MNINRLVKVEGNPASALGDFLSAWWAAYGLDALLAPVAAPGNAKTTFQTITRPDELVDVNPFAPLIECNAAPLVRQFAQVHPEMRLAAILRPCELRAYFELEKLEAARRSLLPNTRTPRQMVLIGIDCLGTYSRGDYFQRVTQDGVEQVTAQVLANAALGGLHPQAFRLACQVCSWPAPRGADLVIGYLGIPSEANLLLIVRDAEFDRQLGLSGLVPGLASEYQVSRRETVIGAIAETHAGVRHKLVEEMRGACRFDDLGCLLAWLSSCSLCGACLEACPLFDGQMPGYHRHNNRHNGGIHTFLLEAINLGRRLVSCDGCGMCSQACANSVPLTMAITALSHSIQEKVDYLAGDPLAPLPWKY